LYRELALKSVKLSVSGRGMVYVCLYALASSMYIIFSPLSIVYINMVVLSLLAIVTSILSDKKTLHQYLSVLILSGMRKRSIFFCIRTYISVRIIPVALVYTICFSYLNLYLVAIVTDIIFVLFTLYLAYPIYKVFK
jgi:Na+-transporting methylmalonyl-CoA/oxaloacetate decarboxylase gamma subunit